MEFFHSDPFGLYEQFHRISQVFTPNWCSFSWTRYRCISVQLWILQFTLFPESSIFDSQCLWVELRIFARLLLLVVILHRLESWTLKDNNPDDIEPCSSTNTDISQCRSEARRVGNEWTARR